MKMKASEESNLFSDEIDLELPDQAQLVMLREAENVLGGLANIFLTADHSLLQNAGEFIAKQGHLKLITSESPDVEARYRILVEQIPAVVFLAFLDKGIGEAYVSPQIEAMLGYTQEEWLNDPVRWYKHIHPDDKARWSLEAAQIFISGEPLRSVYRVIARDGRVIWFHCEAKMVRDDEGHPWFIHGVAFDISELKQVEQTERDYAERLQVLSRRLMQVQETERRYIARELHDEIGQALTGLKLTIEMTLRLPPEQVKASLVEALALVNELVARARNLSLDLRPAMLDDLGLLPALLWHISNYMKQTHVHVTFRHTGLEGRRFTPEVETAAYRIAQEALTNIARHARVDKATVRVWADQNRLGLQVEDLGAGFDPDRALAEANTSGLAGMRERAILSGGQFTVESHFGIGSRLMAEWHLGD
ncbi:MAG: PAS domain-containing protein [Blastocatellia bacterium]